MNTKEPQLGDKARDVISGFTGIVLAETKWLNGCRRITLQSQELHEGRPQSTETFDIEQIEVLQEDAVQLPRMAKEEVKARESGGPMPSITRAATPPRR